MPRDRTKTSDQSREWLPKEKPARSPKHKARTKRTRVTDDAGQWILSKSSADGSLETTAREGAAAEPNPSSRQPRARRNRISFLRSQREVRLQAKVKRANHAVASKEIEIKQLRQRVGELEKALAAGPTKKSSPRRSKARKRDLNAVTFEELREIGLSVTQSARLIAARDTQGEFESLDQLGDIPGFGKKTVENLRARLRVG